MKDTKIYYFFDALCGWCFGFSPVMEKFHREYADRYDFQLISGGLKLGAAVGPIGVVAPYIKNGAYKQVEQRCGVKFGEAFIRGPLEEGTLVLSSLLPAVALSIVKARKPEAAFAFGKLLHEALYVQGQDIGQPENYAGYATQIGLDAADFVSALDDSIYHELARQDFAMARHYGVNSYPTLVVQQPGETLLLARGYTDYATLVERMASIEAV